MPRKGSIKTKTGCFTCKARKVKCDEAKPHCRRCSTTGRPCAYPPPPTGQAAYSWDELLTLGVSTAMTLKRRTPIGLYGADQTERRALEFFRLQVAPVLSRHSSGGVWKQLACQVGQQEPAVRHALACISSLYEGLSDTSSGFLRTSREKFALTQYNKALSLVAAPRVDQNIVLFVCLLFITIETILDNSDMGLQHCRHGINLCNALPAEAGGWAKDELRSIFLRLATVPYFFGTEVGEFPEPVGLMPDLEEGDGDAAVKNSAWEALVHRAVLLIRRGAVYSHQTLINEVVPDSLLQEQQYVLKALSKWCQRFKAQRAGLLPGSEAFETQLWHEMHCIVGRVWAACCISYSQMLYDEYDEQFEEILQLSEQIIDARRTAADSRPKFIFEMGFMPLLYFVAKSCRRLDLRLAALRHTLELACERESFFKTRAMYSAVIRCIEVEHGILLDPARPDHPNPSAEPRPPDDVRIRLADLTDEVENRVESDGQVYEYRKVCFLVRPGAVVPGFVEWVKVRPWPNMADSPLRISWSASSTATPEPEVPI
ncbi:hypothetical protein M406DRAFT_86615 [Cryphonectria parasitica EP155]|uniref:Zn(2)-C6 fungal-type domain-containing protein n=1 Tax=Cryphonectria parasitica (strain ATCC 38755 / EP155) TaxID=660469 RepID=A0A9P4YA92_CRYP1|nr:uncharacterized protein M406DRAFT_86615 [Cryphonectria parasitica EP155]KAF3769807.1 hypothetical protein M406DRAFT_86615 [Cryphonectria parasitica EP155]